MGNAGSSDSDRWDGSIAIIGAGSLLLIGATGNFALEFQTLDVALPPLVAFGLSGGLAGVVIYAGWSLHRSAFEPIARRKIAKWCLGWSAFMIVVSGATIAIRLWEGRVVAEPLLDLLVSGASGGIAGFFVGRHSVRADCEARRVEQARDTLIFLNRMLRHELLNGTNIIHGKAKLLDERVNGNRYDALETIICRSEELANFIQTIPPAAQTFAEDATLEPVDVTARLHSRIDALRTEHPEAEIQTNLETTGTVMANDAVDHVFGNLIHNAIEHNDADTPEVSVTSSTTNGDIRIEVADNGPGIPHEKQEHLFEMDDGTAHGFGLYLVRTLIEHYGGQIWVRDNEPRGSVFVVELPRANLDTPATTQAITTTTIPSVS
jgi:signal transduction histidine kinase